VTLDPEERARVCQLYLLLFSRSGELLRATLQQRFQFKGEAEPDKILGVLTNQCVRRPSGWLVGLVGGWWGWWVVGG
jgi:hypothetical protein